jgi:hypothetical protein
MDKADAPAVNQCQVIVQFSRCLNSANLLLS